MNLFSLDFLNEMERTRREIDRILGEDRFSAWTFLFSRISFLPGRASRAYPLMNVSEDSILTIKGKADYTPPADILRREFNLQGYYRQFQLSDDVDQSKISAESKNGVLTIRLPKAEKSKPRRIKVKLG